MSLAIMLMGWVAASLALSPLLGRFMSLQDEREGRDAGRPSHFVVPAPVRPNAHATLRRSTAVQLSRRSAGIRRIG